VQFISPAELAALVQGCLFEPISPEQRAAILKRAHDSYTEDMVVCAICNQFYFESVTECYLPCDLPDALFTELKPSKLGKPLPFLLRAQYDVSSFFPGYDFRDESKLDPDVDLTRIEPSLGSPNINQDPSSPTSHIEDSPEEYNPDAARKRSGRRAKKKKRKPRKTTGSVVRKFANALLSPLNVVREFQEGHEDCTCVRVCTPCHSALSLRNSKPS
jgi:hypothetical protein